MSNQHETHQGCTHCACNSPLIKIFEKDLSAPETLSKITAGLSKFIAKKGKSLVISGGIIRPLINGAMDTVEAIGIDNGKVIAVGDLASVENEMNTQGIQFDRKELSNGQSLLPGLIEPHVHIVSEALADGFADFGGFDQEKLRVGYDQNWLTTVIQQQKKLLPSGFWILGHCVDPALMPFVKVSNTPDELNELITFNCDYLDTIEKDVPLLMVSASAHTVYVNTIALQKTFENSKEVQAKYSTFENYLATTQGQLQEMVEMSPAIKSMPKLQHDDLVLKLLGNIKNIFNTASSRGVTFLYDASMTKAQKTLLTTYLDLHEKKVRVGASIPCFSLEDANQLENYKEIEDYEDAYYGTVKLVSDGSNQGLTGYQSEKYCCLPDDNYGLFDFPDENEPRPLSIPDGYKQMVAAIINKGWPLMIHANGDYAIDFALDAYGNALKGEKDSSKRHRIEHCSILNNDRIQTMVDLGISPSFLIGHVGYWGYAFKTVIFEKKTQYLDLCKSSLDAGLRISLHSDYGVSPMGPLRMMEQAITRIMEADPELNVLNQEECLTPEQALRAMTYDAAWQCHADKWVGSLEIGHFADFVILEKDPLNLETHHNELRDLPVLETWLGGINVYQS